MEIGTSREGGTRLTWHVPLPELDESLAAEGHGLRLTEPGRPRTPAVKSARTEQTSANPSSMQPASFGTVGHRRGVGRDGDAGLIRRGDQRDVEGGAGRRRDGVDALGPGRPPGRPGTGDRGCW